MGIPDMHLPIQYAILDGVREKYPLEPLDFRKISEITFKNPDMDTFKGLPLALHAGKTGGSLPTVFNAANETAVRGFVKEDIKFLQIYDIIEAAMENHSVIKNPSLDEILETEKETHRFIESRFGI